MNDNKKDLMELYKVKLDLLKPIFNTLIIFVGGAVSFLGINFEKNSTILNCVVCFGIVILSIFLIILTREITKTYKFMKGLL